MSVRKALAALTLLATVLGGPMPARAEQTQAGEAMLALAALGLNLVYVPAKAVMATTGLMLGSVVGLLNGGDTRSAYGIWVPTASGTYVLSAANIEGTEPIRFFGDDYADQPSVFAGQESEGDLFYDALYR